MHACLCHGRALPLSVYCLYCLAASALTVPPTTILFAAPGLPADANLLGNVTAPLGMSTQVASFGQTGGSMQAPGAGPLTLIDPVSQQQLGTLTVQSTGQTTFTPAASFTGTLPAAVGVTLMVRSSDGQVSSLPVNITANPLLLDGSEDPALASSGSTLSINVLDNVVATPGMTVSVVSFSVPAVPSPLTYMPGSGAVTVVDPATGATAGSLTVLPTGNLTFTPAAGFQGQVPAITYTVASSDGQTNPSALTVVVQPGALHPLSNEAAVRVWSHHGMGQG